MKMMNKTTPPAMSGLNISGRIRALLRDYETDDITFRASGPLGWPWREGSREEPNETEALTFYP